MNQPAKASVKTLTETEFHTEFPQIEQTLMFQAIPAEEQRQIQAAKTEHDKYLLLKQFSTQW